MGCSCGPGPLETRSEAPARSKKRTTGDLYGGSEPTCWHAWHFSKEFRPVTPQARAKQVADDPLGTPWHDSNNGRQPYQGLCDGQSKKTKVKGWRATHSQALGPAGEGEAGPQQETAGAKRAASARSKIWVPKITPHGWEVDSGLRV